MPQIKRFIFNLFQVNTYILYDESGECVIIDAGCYGVSEEEEIAGFVEKSGLKPVRLLNTHSHIDHITGNMFISRKYGLKLEAHPDGGHFVRHAPEDAAVFGFDDIEPLMPEVALTEGGLIRFGNSELEIIETPGHAAGSVCFINHQGKFVITGDVLFRQSIGRTDLFSGDFDTLVDSIRNKLFTLPKDYTVYPGHGPETSIGIEMYSNPFLADLSA